jgi:hypothetical protein
MHGSCSDESVSSLKTYTGVDSTQQESQPDLPLRVANGDTSDGDDNAPLLTPLSNKKQTRSRTRKNPLGMFANRQKQSLSPEKETSSDQEKRTTSPQSKEKGLDSIERERSKSDTDDSDAESSRLHRTPFPGFDSLKNGKKETPDVVDGRKPPLAEWTADSTTTTLVDLAQFSNEDISVPFAIDIHRNATKKSFHKSCVR